MAAEKAIIPLKSTLSTVALLEGGLVGYVCHNNGPCHLVLSDCRSIRVSVIGTDIAWRFECFSLALDVDASPTESITPFVTPEGATVISILVREEFVEPYTGDRSLMVGQGPTLVQQARKPGQVPANATASCIVAYGMLLEGIGGRLLVAADWFPFNIIATTEEPRISEFLGESEAMPLLHYIHRYGFAEDN
jgi:hypothetical protein